MCCIGGDIRSVCECAVGGDIRCVCSCSHSDSARFETYRSILEERIRQIGQCKGRSSSGFECHGLDFFDKCGYHRAIGELRLVVIVYPI